jgi:uncharacterized protein Usg
MLRDHERIKCRTTATGGSMASRLLVPEYRLTTAEILYHLPDHPGILQSYIWQELDVAPRYPMLRRFLDFWCARIDGKLHSVRVASGARVSEMGWRRVDTTFRLH